MLCKDKPLLHFVPVHEVGQEIMKITKSLAMEVKKSFSFQTIINKTEIKLKKNHKHKTVYMAIYLITSCHSWVVYGNYGVIVLKNIYK